MLELYNTTKDIKRIPKFNYNGKFVIRPHEAVDIPDDQAFFFKPYAKTGIVVRCKKDATPRKPETVVVNQGGKATSGMLDLGISNNTTVETYSSPSYPEPEVEVKTEIPEAVKSVVEVEPDIQIQVETEVVPSDIHVYAEDELSEMSRDKLREVARTLGLDCDTMGRKKDIQERILNKQKEQ